MRLLRKKAARKRNNKAALPEILPLFSFLRVGLSLGPRASTALQVLWPLSSGHARFSQRSREGIPRSAFGLVFSCFHFLYPRSADANTVWWASKLHRRVRILWELIHPYFPAVRPLRRCLAASREMSAGRVSKTDERRPVQFLTDSRRIQARRSELSKLKSACGRPHAYLLEQRNFGVGHQKILTKNCSGEFLGLKCPLQQCSCHNNLTQEQEKMASA